MSTSKTLLIFAASSVLFLAFGFWLGMHRFEKTQDQYFNQTKFLDVQEKIKILDRLYSNDPSKAISRLENWLDRDALVSGAQNEDHSRLIKPEEKEILQLIANHRTAHPFSRPNSPVTNQMVQKALQGAK
jgi:hypothetical protein